MNIDHYCERVKLGGHLGTTNKVIILLFSIKLDGWEGLRTMLKHYIPKSANFGKIAGMFPITQHGLYTFNLLPTHICTSVLRSLLRSLWSGWSYPKPYGDPWFVAINVSSVISCLWSDKALLHMHIACAYHSIVLWCSWCVCVCVWLCVPWGRGRGLQVPTPA